MILLCGVQEVVMRIPKVEILIRRNVLVLVFIPLGKLLWLEPGRIDLHSVSVIEDAQLMIGRHDALSRSVFQKMFSF